MQTLTLRQPDDFHIHLRDGKALATTVPAVAQQFARALVMPNLNPPVCDLNDLLAYKSRIMAHCPGGSQFQPLMTLYLTDETSPELIAQAKQEGLVSALKLYPANATTNSRWGVSELKQVYPVLEAMQHHGVPLAIHGESTGPGIDAFDREAHFIEHTLDGLAQDFPKLKIILEHITTQEAVDWVQAQDARIAATITAHHLMFDRNAMVDRSINPHLFCLPVLKRRQHQEALIQAATSGSPKFFLGTDSAPHAKHHKESACGCAGVYSSPVAMSVYAQVFDNAGKLDRLENFASVFGAQFYELSLNMGKLTLKKEAWDAPDEIHLGDDAVVPLCAGQTLDWQVDYAAD